MTEVPVIGVDLGFSYCSVGVYQCERLEIITSDQGNMTTPTYVAFTENECLVGDPAKEQASRNSRNTIFDVKRLIGLEFSNDTIPTSLKCWPFKVVNHIGEPKIQVEFKNETRMFSPEEILSMVLSKMKETVEAYLGETVKNAVITAPVYFNYSQRQAIRNAAVSAGLNVLHIANEPTAAALAYVWRKGIDPLLNSIQNVLVFDLDDTVLDVSIVNSNYEIISFAASLRFNEDFDIRIVNDFIREFQRKHQKDLNHNEKALRRLKTACKEARITLSTLKIASIVIESLHEGIDFHTSITRARFEKLNADLFQNMMKPVEEAVRKAEINKAQITNVLLVGCSPRIPKVEALLEDFFDGRKLIKSVDTVTVKACGATLLTKKVEIKPALTTPSGATAISSKPAVSKTASLVIRTSEMINAAADTSTCTNPIPVPLLPTSLEYIETKFRRPTTNFRIPNATASIGTKSDAKSSSKVASTNINQFENFKSTKDVRTRKATTSTGTRIKFTPVTGTDTIQLANNLCFNFGTKNQCIVGMKEYKNKSLEELRYEDYLADRKGPFQDHVKFDLASSRGITNTKNTAGNSFINKSDRVGQICSNDRKMGVPRARKRSASSVSSNYKTKTTKINSDTSYNSTVISSTQTPAAKSMLDKASTNTSPYGDSRSIPDSTAATGTNIKFTAVTGTDTMIRNEMDWIHCTKYQCITVMKEYENKSLEELRYEDYLVNGKVSSQESVQSTSISFGGITKTVNTTGNIDQKPENPNENTSVEVIQKPRIEVKNKFSVEIGKNPSEVIKRPSAEITKKSGVRVNEKLGIETSKEPNVDVNKKQSVEVYKKHSVDIIKKSSEEVIRKSTVEVDKKCSFEVNKNSSVKVSKKPSVEMIKKPIVEVNNENSVKVAKNPSVEVDKNPSIEMGKKPNVEANKKPKIDRKKNLGVSQQKASQSEVANTPAIGIDLGTTNSCVAVFRFGKVEIIANDQGSRTTASYVAFVDDERLVGNPAKDQSLKNLKNTIFDTKRLIGRRFNDASVQADIKNWPFEVINENNIPKIGITNRGAIRTHYPEEISSMVLSKMKELAEAYLGQPVKNTVITVPAYFNDSQRQATKDAAAIAGLNTLRIINEPTAAAIAYGSGKKDLGERTVLIFDLGGGTFDVSILNIKDGIFEVKSTAGDTHLGGQDFDNKMVNYFVEEFEREYKADLSLDVKVLRRLKIACERAKRILSSADTTTVDLNSLHEGIDFHASITRARFEELNADLFERIMEMVEKSIKDAKMDKSKIDDVVLVGGCSRIPKVQKLLSDFFNGKELNNTINPDESVAYGAAVQAAILNGDESKEIRDMLLLDVTPLSLGIRTKGKFMTPVVKRNTSIPVKMTKDFYTWKDDQPKVTFNIFEGESAETEFNELLGEFTLTDIPLAPAKHVVLHVIFHVDVNGILNISAIEKRTGKNSQITITYNKNRLSKDEIERLIQEAEEYKLKEKKRKFTIVAKRSIELYCAQMKETVENEKWINKIDEVDKVMFSKKYHEIVQWLGSHQTLEKEECERKRKELKTVYSLIITTVLDPDKKNKKYFELFDLEEGASEAEILDAFKKVALKYHPDKFKGEKKFGEWIFLKFSDAKNHLIALVDSIPRKKQKMIK